MHDVSGRRRAEAKDVNGATESPRPWRIRRMFVEREAPSGGGVIEGVREEGKSEFWGTGPIGESIFYDSNRLLVRILVFCCAFVHY